MGIKVRGSGGGSITLVTPPGQVTDVEMEIALMVSTFPVGGIIMYAGIITEIPGGWFLCDGTNNTPDLRDRFVMGTATEADIGVSGGSNNSNLNAHTHTRGTMDITGRFDTKKTVSSKDITAGEYQSFYSSGGNVSGASIETGSSKTYGRVNFRASRAWTGVTSTAGSSEINANRPAFVQLAYIMRGA